ncbi:hypothetical protein ABID14_000178 [Peptoniphilus olsenii]|uniref:NurA domain-containing protein n=1 Tax=Peptoniphilus olsenii TaxID=411570 RepID=A0ABV2J709_9FIRM
MINLDNLKSQINEVNFDIKNKYNSVFTIDSNNFKNKLKTEIGELIKLKKIDNENIIRYNSLVGVDGSNNRSGGAFPHFIEIVQGLAKSTNGNEVFNSTVYTPALSQTVDDGNLSQKLLASIEIETALEYIDKYELKYLMMDGGFIRYKIHCLELFKKLRQICEKKGIILFGVIKDIKTNLIASKLDLDKTIYDREILFNRLEIGEAILINNEINKKFLENGDGFSSAFMRTSNFPGAIGVDILDTQQTHLKEICNLIYTLTPINSRGVPLWLDIVDKDVKITDEIIETLLEEFLDRDIYERFFISERDKRTL